MSENNNLLDCSVVKDLLPNYIEGLTGDETNEKVALHLQGCPQCNGSYNYMKARMETPQNNKKEKGVIFLKKQKIKRFVWIIAAVLLLFVFVAFAGSYLNSNRMVPAKDIHVTGLYALSTGEVACAFKVDGLNPSAGRIFPQAQYTIPSLGASQSTAKGTIGLEIGYTPYRKWFLNDLSRGDTFYFVFDPKKYSGGYTFGTISFPEGGLYYPVEETCTIQEVTLLGDDSKVWWPERPEVQILSEEETALLQEKIQKTENGNKGVIRPVEEPKSAIKGQ